MKSPKSQSRVISMICMLSIFCTCFLLTQGDALAMYGDASQPLAQCQGNIMPDVEIVQKVIATVKQIMSVATL